jgi:hypothetical protein
MKALVALFILCSVLISCGDDGQSTAEDGPLTAAEREWCNLGDSSEETALRFDVIFQAGLALGLPMDELNAQAAGLLEDYMADGMTRDEAVSRVSDDLLDEPTFIAACQEAFDFASDG